MRPLRRTGSFTSSVLAFLDAFFSSAERAAIGARLTADATLAARPEFRAFQSEALAERQVQSLADVAGLAVRSQATAPSRRLA